MNKPEQWHHDLTAPQVRAVLHYDPETGMFTWLIGRSDRIGKPARSPASSGYWTLHFQGRNYRCARLAHLYMTGEWPSGEMDHIDGNGQNDSWTNLRVVTRLQNEWNKRGMKNVHGAKGVTMLSGNRRRKWRVLIADHGKKKFLGCFATREEAATVYDAAALSIAGEFLPTRGEHLKEKP